MRPPAFRYAIDIADFRSHSRVQERGNLSHADAMAYAAPGRSRQGAPCSSVASGRTPANGVTLALICMDNLRVRKNAGAFDE
jgi:hypothetical protein